MQAHPIHLMVMVDATLRMETHSVVQNIIIMQNSSNNTSPYFPRGSSVRDLSLTMFALLQVFLSYKIPNFLLMFQGVVLAIVLILLELQQRVGVGYRKEETLYTNGRHSPIHNPMATLLLRNVHLHTSDPNTHIHLHIPAQQHNTLQKPPPTIHTDPKNISKPWPLLCMFITSPRT